MNSSTKHNITSNSPYSIRYYDFDSVVYRTELYDLENYNKELLKRITSFDNKNQYQQESKHEHNNKQIIECLKKENNELKELNKILTKRLKELASKPPID